MMNKPLPSDILSDARKRGVDWLAVAQAFDALHTEASIPAGTTPTRWAEKLSGYSANHLRRMSAGRKFYLELTAASPGLAAGLGAPRFSHLEVLGKIWQLDRDRALQLLKHQPKLSYAGLSELFATMQGQSPISKAASRRVQAQFRNVCIDALVNYTDPLLSMGPGAYTFMSPRVHSDPYCKPDLLIKRVAEFGETTWSGIDFFVSENPNDDAFRRKLVALATESSFLTQYWLCIPANVEVVEHLQLVTDQLELVNLGVLTFTEGTLATIRTPSGPPVHDRRRLWQPLRLWRNIMEIPAR
jgi:hypothetical protein